MQVKGLDGKEYQLKLKPEENGMNKSAPHIKARSLINKLFPGHIPLEEMTIPGYTSPMFADFFLPRMKIMVEVQGRQHFEYVPFFHGNQFFFEQQRRRDEAKRRWCELNGINLIELVDNETEEVWEKRILNGISGRQN